MKHKKAGKVHNLMLTNEGNFADILVKRDDETSSPLVMGQFIILSFPNNFEKVYIGTVESEVPDLAFGVNIKDALKSSEKYDQELDSLYKEENLFVSYRCRMLGLCYDNKKEIKYYSNVRTFPATTSLDAYIPSNDFMNRLFASAVSQGDNDAKDVIFEIGKLQYGTYPDYTKSYKLDSPDEVRVQFNATNLLRKRTAIFGKSGYGKSNTVKTVIGMMSVEHPNCGQLIVDTNGEYAMENSQNDGMMDIFLEAGMKDKCVLYTNRNMSKKIVDKYGENQIKSLKFDVFDQIRPSLEIVVSNLDGQKEPLYLNPWTAAMEEEDDKKLFSTTHNSSLIWSIWYASLFRAGLKPSNSKHSKYPLAISKPYLKHLIMESMGLSVIDEDTEIEDGSEEKKKKTIVLNEDVIQAIVDTYGFTRDGKSLITNDIKKMADYAEWYVEFQMEEKSSVKGFSEIMDNYRRFYALKAFNLDAVEGKSYKSISLGENIFRDLKNNKIVIMDLASVSIKISKALNQHVLAHLLNQASKMFGDFAERDTFDKFDALVFIEEAQNYLKPEEVKSGSIYERIAKEGRKFHIGLVYVTQQPSAIDPSITSQTENIIAMHMSNYRDCMMLNEIKDKFDKLTCKFMKDEAQKGLAYLYAEPHQPFVLPCQIHRFDKNLILKRKNK